MIPTKLKGRFKCSWRVIILLPLVTSLFSNLPFLSAHTIKLNISYKYYAYIHARKIKLNMIHHYVLSFKGGKP